MADVIDWLTIPNAEEWTQRAVDRLRMGHLIEVQLDSGRFLLANLLDHLAMAGLRSCQSEQIAKPILLLSSANECLIWHPELSITGLRLLRRAWPGSAIFSFPWDGSPTALRHPSTALSSIHGANELNVWIPHHPLLQAIILGADFPLAAIEIAETTDVAALTPIVLYSGNVGTFQPTWVHVHQQSWQIEREGSVSRKTLELAATEWIVFVCTGNTCRSPLAMSYMQANLARKFGCLPEELVHKGYWITSAGTVAVPGDAASVEAIELADRFGGASLRNFRSQSISDRLIESADELIAMTRSHLLTLISRFCPGGSTRLFCGVEGDLEDPIGGGIEAYEDCAQTIQRHVDRLILEWNAK